MRKSTVALLTLAAVTALYRGRAPHLKTPAAAIATSSEESVQNQTTRTPAAVAPPATPKRSVEVAAVWPYRDELRRFADLAAKVFVTEHESIERARLIHDPDLLRAAAARLTRRQNPGGIPVATWAVNSRIKRWRCSLNPRARGIRSSPPGTAELDRGGSRSTRVEDGSGG